MTNDLAWIDEWYEKSYASKKDDNDHYGENDKDIKEIDKSKEKESGWAIISDEHAGIVFETIKKKVNDK